VYPTVRIDGKYHFSRLAIVFRLFVISAVKFSICFRQWFTLNTFFVSLNEGSHKKEEIHWTVPWVGSSRKSGTSFFFALLGHYLWSRFYIQVVFVSEQPSCRVEATLLKRLTHSNVISILGIFSLYREIYRELFTHLNIFVLYKRNKKKLDIK